MSTLNSLFIHRYIKFGSGISCAVVLDGADVPVLRQWTGVSEVPEPGSSYDDIEKQVVTRIASAGDVIVWHPPRSHGGVEAPDRIFAHYYEDDGKTSTST